MRLLRLLLCALVVALAPPALADEGGAFEVDFAPLPCGQTDFALDYDFHTNGDHSISGIWHVRNQSATEVRDYYLKDLQASGWLVKAVDKTKLVVYGRKGDPIKKVAFKVDTFEFKPKKDVTPVVRRIKEG